MKSLRSLLGAVASSMLWAQIAGAQGLPAPPDEDLPAPPMAEMPSDSADGDAPEAGTELSRRERLDRLYAELADPGNEDWESAQRQIQRLWARSGSDSMDLLLRRGRDAMNAENYHRAIQHFTALTDHAPEFAEGWNARATAYYLDGEWGPSMADIARTLMLEPRHFGALIGLGAILEQTDHLDGALRAYRMALEVHPHLDRAREGVERLQAQVEGRYH